MSLAYALDDEKMYKVKDETETFVNNLVNLNQYKNVKSFVVAVNTKAIITRALYLLESLYKIKLKENKEVYFTDIGLLIDFFDHRINEVKEYPNKKLKNKMLRINPEAFEVLDFLKLRYSQITSENDGLAEQIKKNLEYKNEEPTKEDKAQSSDKYKQVPPLEYINFFLGITYCYYKNFDADILSPIVKKFIKKSELINNKYNLKVDFDVNFRTAHITTSRIYKKALEKLAQ